MLSKNVTWSDYYLKTIPPTAGCRPKRSQGELGDGEEAEWGSGRHSQTHPLPLDSAQPKKAPRKAAGMRVYT